MSEKKIVIVTIGQPSTNPRMLKEVQTLLDQGHRVKVFYGYWTSWAIGNDQGLKERYPGIFHLIGGSPLEHKGVYFFSRLMHKTARFLAVYFPALRDYSLNRPCYLLEKAAGRERADLYIGHNLGSLPSIVKAAKKWHAPCGFDAEDFHRGQYERPEGVNYLSTIFLEERYMKTCDYLSAASPLIAAAYKKLLPGKNIVVINNVFSKKYLSPRLEKRAGPLKLFWFSQTVGHDRGLEGIVQAMNRLPACEIHLDLMGDCPDSYRDYLAGMAEEGTILHFLPPVLADDLFGVAASYDIGMASEVPHSENRDICLTNKLFTYLLAGNCILASDTRAQRQFMETNPGIGFIYGHDDPESLATLLETLYKDRDCLQQCRERSLALADARYNWESEEQIFLNEVTSVLDAR
jgi:glycosyltransferase involved in cell wall biosynthesis